MNETRSRWVPATLAVALGTSLTVAALDARAQYAQPPPPPPVATPAQPPVTYAAVAPPPPPPAFIAVTAPAYYEGRPTYWYHDHWYYRDARGGWNYYRAEPAYLHDRRMHWARGHRR